MVSSFFRNSAVRFRNRSGEMVRANEIEIMPGEEMKVAQNVDII